MFLVDRGVDERPARPAGDGLATSAECGDELMIFRLKKTCLDNHVRKYFPFGFGLQHLDVRRRFSLGS